MLKLNRLLRRHALRLLCLIAAVLALSQSANAYVGIVGDFSAVGVSIHGWNDYNGTEMTNLDNNQFTYTFLATSEGEVKFRIKVDGKLYGPKYAEDHRVNVPTTGASPQSPTANDYSSWGDKETHWYITCEKNHEYTITYWKDYSSSPRVSAVDDGVVNASETYYIRKNENFNKPFVRNTDGTSLTCTVDNWNITPDNDNDWFKVADSTDGGGNWFTSGTRDIVSGAEQALVSSKRQDDNMYLAASADGKTVTFTLTLNNSGFPIKLTAKWGEGGDTPTTTYYLRTADNTADAFTESSDDTLTCVKENWTDGAWFKVADTND